tara:strand:- start:111 stop:491 length:381 start_codon:yes stop_codon:yes gene_type:complete
MLKILNKELNTLIERLLKETNKSVSDLRVENANIYEVLNEFTLAASQDSKKVAKLVKNVQFNNDQVQDTHFLCHERAVKNSDDTKELMTNHSKSDARFGSIERKIYQLAIAQLFSFIVLALLVLLQ